MKSGIASILIILFVLGFLFLIYKFLSVGGLLIVLGVGLATLSKDEEKIISYIGKIGVWLYPIGVIYTFIYNGWFNGILSIPFGFMIYRMAKSK